MSCTWTSAAEAPGVSCPWTLPDLRRQPEHPGGASSQQHEQGHRRAHVLFPFDRIMSFSAPGPRPADAWTLLRLEVKMHQDHDQAHRVSRISSNRAALGSEQNPSRLYTSSNSVSCFVSQICLAYLISNPLLAPRRTRIPCNAKRRGRRAPANGTAHARARPAPQEKEPPQQSPRRVTPDGACLRVPPASTYSLALSSTPALSARLRRRRAEGETAQLQRQRRGRGGRNVRVNVCSALFGRSSPLSIQLTMRAIWASPSGAS